MGKEAAVAYFKKISHHFFQVLR